MNEKLQNHLEENELLQNRQFNFRKGRGCPEVKVLLTHQPDESHYQIICSRH